MVRRNALLLPILVAACFRAPDTITGSGGNGSSGPIPEGGGVVVTSTCGVRETFAEAAGPTVRAFSVVQGQDAALAYDIDEPVTLVLLGADSWVVTEAVEGSVQRIFTDGAPVRGPQGVPVEILPDLMHTLVLGDQGSLLLMDALLLHNLELTSLHGAEACSTGVSWLARPSPIPNWHESRPDCGTPQAPEPEPDLELLEAPCADLVRRSSSCLTWDQGPTLIRLDNGARCRLTDPIPGPEPDSVAWFGPWVAWCERGTVLVRQHLQTGVTERAHSVTDCARVIALDGGLVTRGQFHPSFGDAQCARSDTLALTASPLGRAPWGMLALDPATGALTSFDLQGNESVLPIDTERAVLDADMLASNQLVVHLKEVEGTSLNILRPGTWWEIEHSIPVDQPLQGLQCLHRVR